MGVLSKTNFTAHLLAREIISISSDLFQVQQYRHSEKQSFLFKSSCRVSTLTASEIVPDCNWGVLQDFLSCEKNSSFQKGYAFLITCANFQAQQCRFFRLYPSLRKDKDPQKSFLPELRGNTLSMFLFMSLAIVTVRSHIFTNVFLFFQAVSPRNKC